ncbi:hypothetical protein [Dermatobacter hominis]|uniref:hypothetical protein n=1 Tax=Dermatobacter hominis TaxID=2884263 RepID=UPI001D111EC2|nr:hypothetical protein [Dermatobacter hominis]UDY37420.1 hypothetical protein LH044_07725 [Dermatobacter hominis]
MTNAVRSVGAPNTVDVASARRRAALRWGALATCLAGLLVGLAGGSLGAGAAAPAPTAPATPALDWLADEMGANGGTMPGFTAGSTDWGLTADAILAFAAAGRTADPAATTATDRLVQGAAAFTTWTSGADTVRDAGATGKTVLALRAMGRPAVADGVDLEAELRSLVVTSGPQAGRFADRVPDPAWDAANGFAQSLSILALALSDDGVPAPSVAYLLVQQCPAGGFRLDLSGTTGCDDDARADTDATALALQALLAVDRTPAVAAALEQGTAWLLGRQGADGSFGGAGPTAAANTNSTGLAAQLLRAAGVVDAADRAAGWIASCCQLGADAAGTPAAADVGAVAYNPAARATALADGVTAQAADQWRRTTAQAVLAFGLAPYGPHDVEPLPPVSTTTTTSAPTTTSSSTTTTAAPTPTTTSVPGETTTTSELTAVEGEQVAVGGGADLSAGSGSTSSGSGAPSGSGLATTGTDPVLLLGAAVTLLAVGAVLAAAGRRSPR